MLLFCFVFKYFPGHMLDNLFLHSWGKVLIDFVAFFGLRKARKTEHSASDISPLKPVYEIQTNQVN